MIPVLARLQKMSDSDRLELEEAVAWRYMGSDVTPEQAAWRDNVILRSAYQRRRIEPPWLWWNDRCYRTVKALHRDVPFERLGTHHKAIDDAISQAQHLIRMLNPDARKPGCIKGDDCTIGTGYCTGCCS